MRKLELIIKPSPLERVHAVPAAGSVASASLLGASIVCFFFILLSLFALNYSQIFSTITAHATDSTTELSINVPTSIAMTIKSSSPQCKGDDLETGDSAPAEVAQLCLRWTTYNHAEGRQTVAVQTNNSTGYTLTPQSDGRLISQTNGSSEPIKLGYSPDHKKTDVMNNVPDETSFTWTAATSDWNYLTDAGTYLANVSYATTANDADVNSISNVSDGVDFFYTGQTQLFTVNNGGYYKLEVWGAQGGDTGVAFLGGRGGYSVGVVKLDAGDKLYIAVGQAGEDSGESDRDNSKYGYNGGGFTGKTNGSSGGGATSIQSSFIGTGELRDYADSKDAVLIVAGGGGGHDGAYDKPSEDVYLSNGGGWTGDRGARGGSAVRLNAYPGTQSQAIRGGINYTFTRSSGFGYGGGDMGRGADNDDYGGGGGSGWYGGEAENGYGSGAGGSGYIGGVASSSTYHITRHMYGYQVPTSDGESLKTITGACASQSPKADCAKMGNGFARITYLGE